MSRKIIIDYILLHIKYHHLEIIYDNKCNLDERSLMHFQRENNPLFKVYDKWNDTNYLTKNHLAPHPTRN